jgi:opacity protein-like surface antigen
VKPAFSDRLYAGVFLPALAVFALLAQPGGTATAADSPDLYVGAAIGASHIESKTSLVLGDLFPTAQTEEIDKTHVAFKVMVGARPISWLGAELDYIDFGEPRGTLFGYPADVSLKGPAAFGLLYLPVPVIDVYLKGGIARLQSTVNGSACSPCACAVCTVPFQVDRTNTSGAVGVGIQYRVGSLAMRAEYERFSAAGGNPSLLSAGVIWSFL